MFGVNQMTLPPFLQLEPGTDYIRLTGHRIGLAHVVRVYNDGVSAEMIATYFPTLELPLVYKVITFYLENRADVDAYVAADDAELRRQEAEYDKSGHKAPTMAELKQRMNRLRPAGS
jgi:uncharacterized protein (DUF433 family)